MYIPATRSFIEVFVCTYTCRYFGQPASFEPYAPLDLYHSLPCNSTVHAVWFAFAVVGIVLLHPMALKFVAFVKNESDPAMRLLPRFNVVFVCTKV